MNIQNEINNVKKRNKVLRGLENYAEENNLLKVESDFAVEYKEYIQDNPIQKERSLIKVQDLQGNIFVLKPDITTNIIKQVIPSLKDTETLDCYYLDHVFSYNNLGQITSNRQFGVELIGKKDANVDIFILQFVQTIFRNYGIELYLEIGNQKIVSEILKRINVSNQKQIKQYIYQKNTTELFKIINQMDTNLYVDFLKYILQQDRKLSDVKSYIINNKLDTVFRNEIERMLDIEQQISESKIFFDLTLIQDLDYYNGFIFKGYIDNYKTDIVRGGRYDLLTKEYGKLTEALGFSLDVDVLIKEVK